MTWLKTDQKLWGVLNLGFWKFLTKNYGILPSRALKKTASRHPRIPKGTPPRCHHRPMIFNITVPGGALGSHTVSAPRPFQQRGHSCAVEVFWIRLVYRLTISRMENHHFPPYLWGFHFKTMVKKIRLNKLPHSILLGQVQAVWLLEREWILLYFWLMQPSAKWDLQKSWCNECWPFPFRVQNHERWKYTK